MVMPGRRYGGSAYRYGFNGQEKSLEIEGHDNSLTAEYWQYDARIGKRWNIDPVQKIFESPYASFSNSPIWLADQNGADTTLPTVGGGCATLPNEIYNITTYQSSNYVMKGSSQSVPVQSGQLRTFSSKLGTFSSRWKKEKGGGVSFLGYQNEDGLDYNQAVAAYNDNLKFEQQLDRFNAYMRDPINLLALAAIPLQMQSAQFQSGNPSAGNPSVIANSELRAIVQSDLRQAALMQGGMFRRISNSEAFASLEVPMQFRTVKSVANDAGVGLQGVKLRIVRDPSFLGRGMFGYAHKRSITLFPDAFQNHETLVRTLGHERTHIFQFSLYGRPSSSSQAAAWESAAFEIENTFLNFYKTNK